MQNGQKEILSHQLLQNDAAFETFFKSHFKELCAFCLYKYKIDLEQSKELVHTAFIKLWESRYQLSTEYSPIGYLMRIIANNAIDYKRHQHVRKNFERYVLTNKSETESDNIEEAFDLRLLTKDIETAVSELPEQMRKIYQLSRLHGLKNREIAREMQLSEKTVETQLSRATYKLRFKLAHHLPVSILLFL